MQHGASPRHAASGRTYATHSPTCSCERCARCQPKQSMNFNVGSSPDLAESGKQPGVTASRSLGSLSIEYDDRTLLDGRSASGVGGHWDASSRRTATMVVVNAASVLEKTDEQLLPSVYKYVACSFQASPGALLADLDWSHVA